MDSFGDCTQMTRAELSETKEMGWTHTMDLFISVHLDPEEFPTVHEELVDITRFITNISSNSPVIILVLFWDAKVIINAIEVLLEVQWRVLCCANSKLSVSLSTQRGNRFMNIQRVGRFISSP
jgi:hypothetical protein